ncbi:MAG: radical SAM protein [Oscillospiraceae bacterium]|nr:radical SAM protein [Oscillospiraceae bacterium]
MKNILQKVLDPFVYLFWAAQIQILVAFPPLHGLAIKHGMNADRSRKLWIKLLFQVLVRAPGAFFAHVSDKIRRRTVLPRVSYAVTTRCTLNCDNCIVHVPDIEHPADIPAERWIEDLQALLQCVDTIYVLTLAGGEAFLHPQLDELLRFCAASSQIGDIDVATNGTIIPNEEVLAALRDAKATVRISRYGAALQPKVEELKSRLKEYSIAYMHEAGGYWYKPVSLDEIQPGSTKRRYRVCAQQLCLVYYHRQIHKCTASAVLAEVGDRIEAIDYVDLRDLSPAAFRAAYQRWHKKRELTACAYCPGASYEAPRVPVAVQRARNLSHTHR